MSETAQIIVGVLSFVTTITTALVGYLIYDLKRVHRRLFEVEKRLDISHHKNFLMRIRLNRIVDAFRVFYASVLEIMESSFKEKRPVTQEQIERLKRNIDIDEILKADSEH